jgi:hypothetical protein
MMSRWCLVFLACGIATAVKAEDGARRISIMNYPDCIELSNPTARVVLGHHVGGRVLVYERGGQNVLFLSPREADWQTVTDEKKRQVTAGRIDIGPEVLSKRGPVIWSGTWTSDIIGPRAARLTSAIDPKSGLKIVREFSLDTNSSHLTITQRVSNHGQQESRHGFWCRAFAVHGGMGIIPLTPANSRYPHQYTLHQDQANANFKPVDPHIRRVDDFLIVDGPPAHPKMGFDSTAGWIAYHTPLDLLFVQKYPVYPQRIYAEPTGMTLSLWYPEAEKIPAVEVEPIGPMEIVPPGQSSTFTVHWWLLEEPFTKDKLSNPQSLADRIATETR